MTSRRNFLRTTARFSAVTACAPWLVRSALAQAEVATASPGKLAPVPLGSRRELFVDDTLIAQLNGGELRVHAPQPREVVITCDEPWEGNLSAFHTIFRDGPIFRMYYRGAHYDRATKPPTLVQCVCYAESSDGLEWTKPNLGLFAFKGSKANNIVWSGVGSHNFVPFRDDNPACSTDARYKAISAGSGEGIAKGLKAFKSADGIHWARISNEPIITDGDFDSQNLAFWDAERKCYFAYHRKKNYGPALTADAESAVRDVMVSTSRDFAQWTEPAYLRYQDNRREHLYTNAIQPYFRAPHLFLGFPTRYDPKKHEVEPIFMSSRDGLNFQRWQKALIPTTAPQDRGGNRSNFMSWGLVELPGRPNELSVFANEAYWTGPGSRQRRFTFRTDGFVSVHAEGASATELVTKPLTFSGKHLNLNVATSAKGNARVELLDSTGRVIRGFSRTDCIPLSTDSIAHRVTWKGGPDLGALAGQPVRLRILLKEADIYALQFTG